MISCRTSFLLSLAVLLLLPLSGRADTPPIKPAIVPATPTLAQELAQAEAPKDTLLLTVTAEKVMLPPEALLPRKGDPARQMAQVYGRTVQEFGGVTAAAPPTMTVLNTDPGTPHPYDGMPPDDVLKLLLASLSDSQWKTLTSATGLGMGDLTGETQPALFLALFPGNSIKLYPRRAIDSYGGEDDTNLRTLTPADIRQGHLRLGQRVTLGMPIRSEDNGTFNALGPSPGGLVQYELYRGTEGVISHDMLFGVTLRAVVPNVSKPADLDYEAKALQTRVSLAGVKTVGELVSRISASVKIELYADHRYEARSVTALGLPSARAADLLRALALCVTGTYRRVGSAYVLTDDLLGVGARQMILSHFVEAADLARLDAISDAGDELTRTHGIGSLPLLDSSLTLSDAQKAAMTEGDYLIPGTQSNIDLPLAKLTPEQQAFARQAVGTWNTHLENETEQEASPDDKAKLRVTLTKPFMLRTEPTLLLQTPSVSGAILLDAYISADSLMGASQKLRTQFEAARYQKILAAHPTPPVYVLPVHVPPLGPLLARIPRRAVLFQPKTAKEVDTLVAEMKTVGLNQLWLDVFSNGKSHLDSTPDIVTEALKQTKGTGIAVFPVLSLLRWGLDAPEEARDRTVLGETSAEADVRYNHYQAVKYQGLTPEEADKLPPPADLSVCPVAPSVQGPLLALVRRLAAMDGVAGLVLRDTLSSGYDRPDLSIYGTQGGGRLGYAPVLRLAFLRRTHVDPVDLVEEHINGAWLAGVDISLPELDDSQSKAPIEKEWAVFRTLANLDLLQRIYAAAKPLPTRKPVLWIDQRRSTGQNGQDDWYGLWNGPLAPLPEKSEALAYGGERGNIAEFAHGQCRVNLYKVHAYSAFGTSKAAFADVLQGVPPGWDGMVLDLNGGASDPVAAPLPPAPTTNAAAKSVPGK